MYNPRELKAPVLCCATTRSRDSRRRQGAAAPDRPGQFGSADDETGTAEGNVSCAWRRYRCRTASKISDTRPRSRGAVRPSFARNLGPRETEGAGNAGRSPHPQPRVRNETKHTSVVTTGSPESPGIPCAMVLTASFVLFPVTGLFCHRRLAGMPSAKLDASVGAPEPHDFAVRLQAPSSKAPSASIASRPASVTSRNAPLWDGTAVNIR